MALNICVLVEDQPDPRPAALWALAACAPGDAVTLVAGWRRGQSEWDPSAGAVVDAPTGARLRLLRLMDRLRAEVPGAPLRLSPRPGSPVELMGALGEDHDLVALAAGVPRRWRAYGRSRSLLAATRCSVVVVAESQAAPATPLEMATLIDPVGARREIVPADLHRLTRP